MLKNSFGCSSNLSGMGAIKLELKLREIESCPICQAQKIAKLGTTKTINPHSNVRLSLMECLACGHWFINPAVDQKWLNQLYSAGDEYVVPRGWGVHKKDFSVAEKYIIKSETQVYRKGKKYLEIGLGQGKLFEYFQSLGYECFGVEPGPWSKCEGNIVKDIAELEKQHFEVLVLVDVLEHLAYPGGFVKALGNVVDAGTMYACFPNCQSVRAYFLKEKWRMIRPLGHLHFFSKKSLSILFESNGFSIKDLFKTDLVSLQGGSNKFRSICLAPLKLPFVFTQRFFGDQWIVQAAKCTLQFCSEAHPKGTESKRIC